jgi:hypothetical protein
MKSNFTNNSAKVATKPRTENNGRGGHTQALSGMLKKSGLQSHFKKFLGKNKFEISVTPLTGMTGVASMASSASYLSGKNMVKPVVKAATTLVKKHPIGAALTVAGAGVAYYLNSNQRKDEFTQPKGSIRLMQQNQNGDDTVEGASDKPTNQANPGLSPGTKKELEKNLADQVTKDDYKGFEKLGDRLFGEADADRN